METFILAKIISGESFYKNPVAASFALFLKTSSKNTFGILVEKKVQTKYISNIDSQYLTKIRYYPINHLVFLFLHIQYFHQSSNTEYHVLNPISSPQIQYSHLFIFGIHFSKFGTHTKHKYRIQILNSNIEFNLENPIPNISNTESELPKHNTDSQLPKPRIPDHNLLECFNSKLQKQDPNSVEQFYNLSN